MRCNLSGTGGSSLCILRVSSSVNERLLLLVWEDVAICVRVLVGISASTEFCFRPANSVRAPTATSFNLF